MTKFFKKSQKNYFGVILGYFCQNFGKNEFSWKKGLWQFLNIPITYHGAETWKNKQRIPDKNAELLINRQKDR